VLNKVFYFLPSAEYIFIFDYLTVILPRRLLSTATARYSTHPQQVDDNRTQSLMSTSVDISTKRVKSHLVVATKVQRVRCTRCTGCAKKKQSPRKNFVSQQWQHGFEPNFQAVYTSIRATYLANFIKTADMV